MSSETELPVMPSEQDLFGASDNEMSDLDGDQGSDDEFNNNDKGNDPAHIPTSSSTYQQEQYNEANTEPTGDSTQGPASSLSSVSVHRLPSFKRRERSKEEDEQLEQLRQELRKNRQSDHDDERADIPKDPQQAIRDEVADVFDRALKAGNKKRKKRLDGDDLKDSKDEELSNLCERMKVAAETDVVANEQQKPAVAKLKMLDEVMISLNNSSLYDSILDNQLLDAIRVWLEPLPDRALPSLEIQNEMLDILDKLPAAAEHLRESGIGKIVFFYKKSTRVESVVQRKADHLVAKWTRLVLRRSESYRERPHQIQEYNKEEVIVEQHLTSVPFFLPYSDETRTHVSIPLPVAPDYDIVPQSTVRIDKIRSSKNHPFKRLKSRMRTLGQTQRKKKDE
ncbi:hypothetical protein [Absidia glauca]|uniref:TFIIS N-terminal domain-containing protein n=1 Tax=Absidia glauca TaxID=4829 RepID=A0A168PL68_ABSGL|nr:hypothetical protein [Absidia glauca]